jgi:hypothetical protein
MRLLHPVISICGVDCMQDIITVVQNLGIPMACLIATFWLWNKERDEHKLSEDKMSEAIQNNTLVMQKLIDKIGSLESNDNGGKIS